MTTLANTIAAGRQHYIAKKGVQPATLALGRWDVRELAGEVSGLTSLTPIQFFREARRGITAWGAQVKVDGRIGRMPAALYWHP